MRPSRFRGRAQGLAFFMVLVAVWMISCDRNAEEGKARQEKQAEDTSIPNGKESLSNFFTGKDNYVRALAFEEDILWVGTSGGVLKVDRLTENLLATYTKKDGLKNNYVFAIFISFR